MALSGAMYLRDTVHAVFPCHPHIRQTVRHLTRHKCQPSSPKRLLNTANLSFGSARIAICCSRQHTYRAGIRLPICDASIMNLFSTADVATLEALLWRSMRSNHRSLHLLWWKACSAGSVPPGLI